MYKIRDYPYLVIQDRVLFPGLLCGVDYTGDAYQQAARAAWSSPSRMVAVFTTLGEAKGLDDLYPVGVLAAVRELREGSMEVEVLERVRLRDVSRLPHPIAQVEHLEAPALEVLDSEAEELDSELRILAEKIFRASGEMGRRAASLVDHVEEGRYLALVEVLASTLAIPARDALEVLGATTVGEAQRLLLRAQKSLWAKHPRDMVRRVSWPEVDEVGDEGGEESASRLRELVDELELEPEIMDRLAPELERLDRFDPVLFEHQETLARLEGLLAYPWGLTSEELPPLEQLEKALENAVHGHERVKGLLLDALSVRYLRPGTPLPLLILAGPPGLGQGTLVRALALALSRPVERILLPSQGAERLLAGIPRGVADAKEGAVFQAALAAAVTDPVLYLCSDSSLDDATSRLLATLTGFETSRTFPDAFLGLPIDASQMMVVLKVRSPEMVPEWLRARALVLEMEGYCPAERRAVLVDHLWPEALREAGLRPKSVRLQAALVEWLIAQRTQEAGVRHLSALVRQLASRLARRKAAGTSRPMASLSLARECLGEAESQSGKLATPGVIGQVVLDAGGACVLEVAALPGRGSAVIKSQTLLAAEELALSLGRGDRGAQRDWHLVTPPGALPQEEAALAFALALAVRSARLGLVVPRDLAVAGRLGVGGEILPVSHPRERALAAWRAGYGTLLVSPAQLDLLTRVLPEEVRADLRLVAVATLEAAARTAMGTYPAARGPAPRRPRNVA